MNFEGFEVNANGQFLGAAGAIETLLKFAYQAANGVEHLAAAHIIHRDLALRNLLITANHIVKISDFGMSRRLNSIKTHSKPPKSDVIIPIRWMAIESLFNGQYSQKSDVWSFGIVLWEMFSCGKRPYSDHELDASLGGWLRQSEDNRMGPPKIACEPMYQLMRECWREDPDARPTFSECKRIIARNLEQKSIYQSVLLNLSDAWMNMSKRESQNRVSSSPTDQIVNDAANATTTENDGAAERVVPILITSAAEINNIQATVVIGTNENNIELQDMPIVITSNDDLLASDYFLP